MCNIRLYYNKLMEVIELITIVTVIMVSPYETGLYHITEFKRYNILK